MERDLKYRGFRDDRITTFTYRTEALFHLYQNVRDCQDEHEYALLRQRWDSVTRPSYQQRVWSEKQQEALDLVQEATSYDDEEAKSSSRRWLFIKGRPGSGKSLVLLEMAIRCAKKGLRVLMVCPTGTNVYGFKSQIPEFSGADLIGVDTIQGVLKYKRPGQDSQVAWAPPSALRRIDVLLCDEASQYADTDWQRFFTSVKEQPHLPYTVVVADFQQLPPVGSAGLCQQFCQRMQTVELDTVYRSSDPEHLLFQRRICEKQPTRELLQEYFEGRHWQHKPLEWCVARGMQMAREAQCVFTWLTTTNAGAEEISRAALRLQGIGEAELARGFVCDPQTKSTLRILARPGIILRLSRNLDKQRGFVNGALAEVVVSLRGNAVFVAKLLQSGNYVLIHAMREDGAVFLPCCYGYATTIRRAQGTSLQMGALYFNQRKFPAGRGYGYVGISRFRSRLGCYLYGKLRRTDFLPVGEDQEYEALSYISSPICYSNLLNTCIHSHPQTDRIHRMYTDRIQIVYRSYIDRIQIASTV